MRERRKALAADYGFMCTCVACAAEEKEETQRFQEVAERSLMQEEKEVEHDDRHKQDSLDDLLQHHKRNQEFAWKVGNLRLENLRI